MMRQDPDVILVGEIRDQETAEMAFRAAMTGHQVYSTLHTNSSIGAMPRLMDLGVLPDIMAGNHIGALAPRVGAQHSTPCHGTHKPPAPARQRPATGEADTPPLHQPGGRPRRDNVD